MVIVVEAVIPVPEVAISRVLPVCLPRASPAGLILAIEDCALVQVTDCVTSCLLPSLNTPVAVSCWLWPDARVGAAGEIKIEAKADFDACAPIPGTPPPQPEVTTASESAKLKGITTTAPRRVPPEFGGFILHQLNEWGGR